MNDKMSTAQSKLRSVPPIKSRAMTKPVKNFLDIPGCKFSETGLTIESGLKYEHWERIGEVLKKAESGIQWWIGDWMAYGDHEYKEKYAQAVDAHEETGLNVDTLRNYQWVSEHVPPVMRITNLPWSFHQVVAALPEVDQKEWLGKAQERKEQGDPYTFRELKRDIEKSQRAKNFRLVNAVLDKIWERIQDGCYTAEAIMKCSECGKDIFGLDTEEIQLYMQQLVGSGKAEWRKQGGKKDDQRGDMPKLCVPAGMPAGSDFVAGYRPKVEYGDEEDHY